MKYFLSLVCFLVLNQSSLAAASEPSLRDKIGQMLIIGFNGKQVNAKSPIIKAIDKNNVGGIILFNYDSYKKVFDKNIDNSAQVKKLNKDLQQFHTQSCIKKNRPQLPLIISLDYEGGRVSRLAERHGFPATISAAEASAKSLAEVDSIAKKMSNTLKEHGFNLNFSPVLDVNINPDNPVIGKLDRSFSKNPLEVAKYASIYSQNFLHNNIQCAYKHFPGHGSSTKDSHLGFVEVTNTWKKSELKPYELILNSKTPCGAVMTAHIVNRHLDPSGLPGSLSKKILTDLLRKQLHFKGVIITDDLQMKAIQDNYKLEETVVLAINAGADMLLFGNNLTAEPQDPQIVIDIIQKNIMSGHIKLESINRAYERIIKLKQSLA